MTYLKDHEHKMSKIIVCEQYQPMNIKPYRGLSNATVVEYQFITEAVTHRCFHIIKANNYIHTAPTKACYKGALQSTNYYILTNNIDYTELRASPFNY